MMRKSPLRKNTDFGGNMKPDDLGKTVRMGIHKIYGIDLEYYLVRSVRRISGRFSYSVVLDQSADGERETVYCADVTRSKRRADEIFSLISDGEVTACTFFDVLEDMI